MSIVLIHPLEVKEMPLQGRSGYERLDQLTMWKRKSRQILGGGYSIYVCEW